MVLTSDFRGHVHRHSCRTRVASAIDLDLLCNTLLIYILRCVCAFGPDSVYACAKCIPLVCKRANKLKLEFGSRTIRERTSRERLLSSVNAKWQTACLTELSILHFNVLCHGHAVCANTVDVLTRVLSSECTSRLSSIQIDVAMQNCVDGNLRGYSGSLDFISEDVLRKVVDTHPVLQKLHLGGCLKAPTRQCSTPISPTAFTHMAKACW